MKRLILKYRLQKLTPIRGRKLFRIVPLVTDLAVLLRSSFTEVNPDKGAETKNKKSYFYCRHCRQLQKPTPIRGRKHNYIVPNFLEG